MLISTLLTMCHHGAMKVCHTSRALWRIFWLKQVGVLHDIYLWSLNVPTTRIKKWTLPYSMISLDLILKSSFFHVSFVIYYHLYHHCILDLLFTLVALHFSHTIFSSLYADSHRSHHTEHDEQYKRKCGNSTVQDLSSWERSFLPMWSIPNLQSMQLQIMVSVNLQ